MRHNASLSNARGFSLIELSIALLVLGLIAVPLMQMYKVYRYQKALDDTWANNTIVQTALGDFYMKNGYYPRPSNRRWAQSNVNYGRSYTGALPAAGSCIAGNGLCVGLGSAFQADTVTAIANPDVLIGGVPFADLAIPPENALDGWGRKLVYVVTENQTIPGSFNRNTGTINMNTFNVAHYKAGTVASPGSYVPADSADPAIPPSIPRLYTNFHILILSLGEDGAGAYNQNGNLYAACAGGRADSENCDNDGTFFNPIHADLGNDQTAGAGKRNGAYHYDDLMVEISDVPTGIWSYSRNNPNDVVTFKRVAIGSADQGIELNDDGTPVSGSSSFDDSIVLDVGGYDPVLKPSGGIMATTIAGASQICDVKGENCFLPEALGGDDTSNHISCGDKDANGNALPMTGVALGSGLCDLELPATPITCPVGQQGYGFSGGTLQCH